MGNWRTVTLVGTVDAAEVAPLIDHLTYSYDEPGGFDNFGPLSFNSDQPGLAGLGCWVQPAVAASGNLAERDYDPESVAETLRELMEIAPSLELKVHCGGDWESEQCIATITAHAGQVTVGPPEVATVSGATQEDMMSRLMQNLRR